jgi:sarcosine oxidase subunit beta
MKTCDVIIIGGGVIGAASAYFVSRAGFKTIVLEKRAALGALTTSASLAAFRAQFADAETIAMMQESIAFFENCRELTGIADADIGMVQQGYLFCTTVEDGYARSQRRVELQRQLGLTDVELWDGDETRRHFPFIAPNVTAATFRAKDGWLSPNDLTNLYARASGAELLLETEVADILVQNDLVRGVHTNRGEIHSPHVVIAAGPFTKILAARFGLELPITLIRRQHAAVKEHALIPHYAPMTIDADTGAHWRPEARGAILAMPTPEEPGAPLDDVKADWDFPARVIDAVTRITPFWEEVARAFFVFYL